MPLDHDRLLNLTSEIGCRLMECGGEIYRVEESIQRLLQAYGVSTGEVFAIPNCIIVSITLDAGQPLTRIRRVPSHGTDIDLLERYNALCRALCADTPSLPEAQARFEAITRTKRVYSAPAMVGGYFLGAAAFTLFFGGTWRDALCSGVCGIAMYLCLYFMGRLGTNLFFKTLAAGAVSALLALGFTWSGAGQNSDLIIIGALMLLVPGMIFTSAMRDIMAGDTMSGISKTAEALLIGAAIALGTGAARWLSQLLWR